MTIAFALAVVSAPVAWAEPGAVEKVVVQGLVRMTPEAFRHVLQIREGDAYDPKKAFAAFRRLWDLGLFQDLTIEAEDGSGGGKLLVVKVTERPILLSVTYEDNKILTRTQIEDRLKEKKVGLDVGKPLNAKSVFEAEGVIRDYLGEKGYLNADVRHDLRKVTETSYGVEFGIRPGGKTRIRAIVFTGNRMFSGRKLKEILQLTREWKWYSPWSAKSLYHPVKWDQDVGGVRDLYLNLGFLDVEIRPPVVELKEIVGKQGKTKSGNGTDVAGEPVPTGGNSADAPPVAGTDQSAGVPEPVTAARSEKERKKEEKERKKAEKKRRAQEPKVKRWVYLTVPIVEGEQYRTGKITVTGNTVLSEAEVRSFVPLREGSILGNGQLKAGIDAITLAYGNRGYLYASAVRQIRRREGEKVGDIDLTITEDKPYYVSRIDFSGNTMTQDKVLRREIRLNEGALFNRSLLEVSKTKLNQLGYFEVQGEPAIEPVSGENRVRITFQGEEKGKNEIQVGGGYSGLDGAFFTGYYSTRNFLGAGEIVSISAQIGGRADAYSLQFLEPWFLNRPYSLGFNIFRNSVDYGSSTRSSGRGFGTRVGRLFGYYTYAQLRYDRETVTSTGFTTTGGQATNLISSLTPSVAFNKVNNPYRPNRGWSVDVSVQAAGAFLGGDTSFLKSVVRYSGYRRANRRSFFGLHSEVGWIRPFAGDVQESTATVYGVPRYQRFWLGGDTYGPRVFEVRTITPRRFVRLDPITQVIIDTTRDPRGDPVSHWDLNGDGKTDRADLVDLGGNRFYLIQAEYVLPLGQTVEAAVFTDVGSTLFEDMSLGAEGVRASVGVEVRFYLPVFPVPLRLIYGRPLRRVEGDITSNFTFSIGRSF